MILAIDIGNSSISCGIFPEVVAETDHTNLPVPVCRFKIAARAMSADEYLLLFCQFLTLHHIAPAARFLSDQPSASNCLGTLNSSVIASVVPTLTDLLAQVAEKLTGSRPFLIGPGIRTGFGLRIRNPEQLGADIVANTAAAMLMMDTPFVVLDVGTATTITFVNSNKELLGIVIMAGLAVSLSALTDSAALLAHVPLEKPEDLLGKTTADAIRSGVMGGHALMIDGFLRNIRETYLEKDQNGDMRKMGLVATGGLAASILPFCRNKFTYEPDLTLMGAVSLWQKNNMQRKQG